MTGWYGFHRASGKCPRSFQRAASWASEPILLFPPWGCPLDASGSKSPSPTTHPGIRSCYFKNQLSVGFSHLLLQFHFLLFLLGFLLGHLLLLRLLAHHSRCTFHLLCCAKSGILPPLCTWNQTYTQPWSIRHSQTHCTTFPFLFTAELFPLSFGAAPPAFASFSYCIIHEK